MKVPRERVLRQEERVGNAFCTAREAACNFCS